MEQVTIRTGTPADIDAMMKLAMDACEDNGLTEAAPEKILQEIWSALNLVMGMVAIIGEPGEEIEAAALIRLEPMWYSHKMTIVERAIFVNSKYRSAKGGRAAKLCQFVKKMQEDMGLPAVIGILSTNRTEAKRKLYERSFGPPAGHYWILGAKTGEWAQ